MAALKKIDSANFNQKPLWFNAVNGLWQSSYALGTKVKLDKDDLIKTARSACKLKDFGPDFWDEPLDKLLHSINNEADLHAIGRFITKKRMENLLSVRLRAEAYFKKHPEILEQSIYPVTAILGLQRTGTTKLQRLLAADPDCRALRSWEALNPSPIKGDDHTGAERIKFAKMSENALKYMSPGFFAIHPVEHLAPEEDVLLLDVSFLSTTAEATMHVPFYASWLEKTDQNSAYAYSAKLMKFLQWQQPAKKWVIKTPHHLEFPDLVVKHFGDVQFVWTHRNVMEAIPSFLSMVAYSRALFSNNVNAHSVAEHWVRKITYMLTKAVAFRSNPVENQKFVDVAYEELVRDSKSVLSSIYAHRNDTIKSDLWEIFAQAETKSPKGKYGAHHYDLKDFGIDAAYINQPTDFYQDYQKHLFKS
jgi:hypothetical protein